MTTPSADAALDPAARVGIPVVAKDPAVLSARLAEEAVRRVHDLDDVDQQAPLETHADPKVPGANYVETDDPSDPRYWVGMAGEVVRTSTGFPRPHRHPDFTAARTRYTAAVDAVRLHHRVPVCEELFAVPDAFVPGAFFVHDTDPEPTVRWVGPDGSVHDGYRLVDGAPSWDAATVAVRHGALAARPSTAALVE